MKLSDNNRLNLVFPEIAREWPTKNGMLTPKMVAKASNQKVYWLCSKGHAYYASVASRVLRSTGYPYCSGKKSSDINNLAIHFPEIAKEWHPSKNGILTPKNVNKASVTKVWWLCSKGHEYQASIHSRTTHNIGCPYCSTEKPLSTII